MNERAADSDLARKFLRAGMSLKTPTRKGGARPWPLRRAVRPGSSYINVTSKTRSPAVAEGPRDAVYIWGLSGLSRQARCTGAKSFRRYYGRFP